MDDSYNFVGRAKKYIFALLRRAYILFLFLAKEKKLYAEAFRAKLSKRMKRGLVIGTTIMILLAILWNILGISVLSERLKTISIIVGCNERDEELIHSASQIGWSIQEHSHSADRKEILTLIPFPPPHGSELGPYQLTDAVEPLPNCRELAIESWSNAQIDVHFRGWMGTFPEFITNGSSGIIELANDRGETIPSSRVIFSYNNNRLLLRSDVEFISQLARIEIHDASIPIRKGLGASEIRLVVRNFVQTVGVYEPGFNTLAGQTLSVATTEVQLERDTATRTFDPGPDDLRRFKYVWLWPKQNKSKRTSGNEELLITGTINDPNLKRIRELAISIISILLGACLAAAVDFLFAKGSRAKLK